ncbi:5-formyltetrahydrofolate cyclo-ligase [Occultella glacieicola]|uniref:5-formyltetrahydrofolate cyclo-ligase n=1 Tax=Occultella glacieicola TaxID=2518684 RepID=A0ABY2E895_9MICO|nr:5-formyltetrahydrofolate cyclo-ligase [Occultella glacieicola]TDE94096.1 5-formyltetrahydrofolate cyclo-ligase [Occultella glacieicola]
MWSVANTLPRDAHLEMEDAKQIMRDSVRAHRTERSDRERREAAEAIAVHAAELLEDVRCVATYAARRTEPDTAPLLETLDRAGISILLPMLGPGLSRDWARYRPGDPLEVRAPGRPPDPEGPGLGAEALAEADLILTPALSVDAAGNRLGQGGGWYDRALAHARPDARVIAILFDDEVSTEPLPVAPHDRRVDGVLTPRGIVRATR